MTSAEDTRRGPSPAVTPTRCVSTAVVEAVADHAGIDPTRLPPLYAAVDPDALDAIFGAVPGGPRRRRGWVEFSYAGHRVRVNAAGVVKVTPD